MKRQEILDMSRKISEFKCSEKDYFIRHESLLKDILGLGRCEASEAINQLLPPIGDYLLGKGWYANDYNFEQYLADCNKKLHPHFFMYLHETDWGHIDGNTTEAEYEKWIHQRFYDMFNSPSEVYREEGDYYRGGDIIYVDPVDRWNTLVIVIV